MYRLKEIQQALAHLVGWRQAFNPAQSIDSAITETESGLYFQDAHPFMTLENIKAVMPDDWDYQYPDWNMVISYKEGAKVRHNDIVWVASKDNVGEEPTASDFDGDFSKEDYGNPYWKPYNFLSDYLSRLTDNGISAMVQKFIEMKQLSNETKSLLERRTLFDGAGKVKATQQNTHKIVGMEIVPVRSMGVTTKIERVGLQMYGGTGNVRLYLFHSSQVDPIKTYDLQYTMKNGGFQWFTLDDCYLPYVGEGNNAGGAWYLCYDQDELPKGMEAINVSKDWSREPCGTCNIGSIETWRQITKYMQISPFMYQAPETFHDFPELWDISGNMYTNTNNYGINCEVTVGCDITDLIISQRAIFQSVLQKQVASIALRTMALNPDVRVNRRQSNVSKEDVLFELVGNTSGRETGIEKELKQSYAALSIDTKGLDRVCMTCQNGGVRYRSVW